MLTQIETRLTRNQLRLSQVVETAWALFELNGSLQGELTERLLADIDRRARAEGVDQVRDALLVLGALPLRRPWPLIEPLSYKLRNVDMPESALLCEVIDALARLRYDDVKLLEVIEINVERSLTQQRLHEAQACTMLEAIGTLGYHGRTGTLVNKLLERIGQATLLLPHSGVALTHGLALLRTEPPEVSAADAKKSKLQACRHVNLQKALTAAHRIPETQPLSLNKITALIATSGLPLELADVRWGAQSTIARWLLLQQVSP
jgi:hypothetical protein